MADDDRQRPVEWADLRDADCYLPRAGDAARSRAILRQAAAWYGAQSGEEGSDRG